MVGSNVGSSLPSYWDSPEAAKLFGFSYKNGDDVYLGLQQIVESLFEFVCQSLGTEALITTKYHAEYAGEGVEYSWGAAKAVY